MEIRFEKYEFIRHQGKTYQCIVCDEETAVFGEVLIAGSGEYLSVTYENLFAVANMVNMRDGFEYETIGNA